MNTHKDKGEYPIYKSKCCGVGVSVTGIGITQYYVCNKCDKPCDFVPMTTSSKTNKEIEKIVKEVLENVEYLQPEMIIEEKEPFFWRMNPYYVKLKSKEITAELISLFIEEALRRIERLKVKEGVEGKYNLSEAGEATNDTLEEVRELIKEIGN